jgi:hypothetical protein
MACPSSIIARCRRSVTARIRADIPLPTTQVSLTPRVTDKRAGMVHAVVILVSLVAAAPLQTKDGAAMVATADVGVAGDVKGPTATRTEASAHTSRARTSDRKRRTRHSLTIEDFHQGSTIRDKLDSLNTTAKVSDLLSPSSHLPFQDLSTSFQPMLNMFHHLSTIE